MKIIMKLSLIFICYLFLLPVYPAFTIQSQKGWQSPVYAAETTPQTVKFLYDGDGVRVAKIERDKTTVYVGDMEKNINSGETIKYYGLGGKRIAVKDNSGTNYIVSEHLGSLTTLIDSTGKSKADIRYYPYGTVRVKTGTALASRQYTSQINDDSTGLYFYNARYYNPSLGIFLTPDKVGGNGRFIYTSGNPINRNDPSGNEDEPSDIEKLLIKIFAAFGIGYDSSGKNLVEKTPLSPNPPSQKSLQYQLDFDNPYFSDLSNEFEVTNTIAEGEDFNYARSLSQSIYYRVPYNKLVKNANNPSKEQIAADDRRKSETFSDLLQNDRAVCLDMSILLGYFLSESGIPNEVMYVGDPSKNFIHAVVSATVGTDIAFLDPTKNINSILQPNQSLNNQISQIYYNDSSIYGLFGTSYTIEYTSTNTLDWTYW